MEFFMILYMYIGPRAGADFSPDDKISVLIKKLLLLQIMFVKFHHDTPSSKGTRGQKCSFCTLTSGITLSEINEICPLTIPSKTFSVQKHMQNLKEIRVISNT